MIIHLQIGQKGADTCTDIRGRSTVHRRRYFYHSLKQDRSEVTQRIVSVWAVYKANAHELSDGH